MTDDRNLNIRYSAAQAVLWMSFCTVITFAVVFLQSRGYSNSSTGIIMAASNLAGFFLSGTMSDLIDRYEKVTVSMMIRVTLGIQALSIAFLFFLPGKSVAVSLIFGAGMAAVLARNPLITQLCVVLQYAGRNIRFNICRGIGSLAYVIASVFMGRLVVLFSPEILNVIAAVFLLLQLAIDIGLERKLRSCGGSMRIQKSGSASTTSEFIRKNPRFIILVIGATIIFFGHNTITYYLINVLRNLGGNEETMGYVNGLSAAYEIPIMFLFVPLTKRLKISSVMKFSFVAFALKNTLMALVGSIPAFCAALSLQGLSYAVYITASVGYAKTVIPPEDAAKGQAFIANVSMIGAVLAGLIGGRLYDTVGVNTTLLIDAAIMIVGAILGILGTQRIDGKPAATAP